MTSTGRVRHVAVIGGGFAGLAAALELVDSGASVDLIESAPDFGGLVRTVHPEGDSGPAIDVGAEAMHPQSPVIGALIDRLGLAESTITANRGSSRLATLSGRLRPLPAGVGPSGPTRLVPVVRSGTLSFAGLARAGLEPLMARLLPRLSADEDISVGAFVTSRFGRAVCDTFVDPLLGSLHAADVHRLSLRATAPGLVSVAEQGDSVVLTARPKPAGTSGAAGSPGAAGTSGPVGGAGTPGASGPGGAPPRPSGGNSSTLVFVTWGEGLRAVTDAAVRELTRAGAHLRPGTTVTSIDPAGFSPGTGYRLQLSTGEPLFADAVILAIPAPRAADLVRPHAPGAADQLAVTEFADVATVLLGLPADEVRGVPALEATGLLIPSGTGSLLKAATFLSRKWPHLAPAVTPGEGIYWMRLSAGRSGDTRLSTLDDDALVDHLRRDLRRFTGIDVAPRHVHVQRWPGAMPQQTVGHRQRLAAARSDLAEHLPGFALAGSSYDGLGLAAVVGSGQAAARTALQVFDTPPTREPSGRD